MWGGKGTESRAFKTCAITNLYLIHWKKKFLMKILSQCSKKKYYISNINKPQLCKTYGHNQSSQKIVECLSIGQ